MSSNLSLRRPSDGQGQASYEMTEKSRYLVKLSVCDSYFISKSPFSIARVSLLLAMKSLKVKKDLGVQECLKEIYRLPGMTLLCARCLRHVYLLATMTDTEEEGDENDARADMYPTSVLPEQY